MNDPKIVAVREFDIPRVFAIACVSAAQNTCAFKSVRSNGDILEHHLRNGLRSPVRNQFFVCAHIFELDMTLPLVLAVVIMVGYLICWLLAKKKSGAITAALVLFCLDTLALLGIAFGVMESPLVNLLDLVFHVIGIIALAQGVAAGAKLKNLPPEQVPEAPSADDIRYL